MSSRCSTAWLPVLTSLCSLYWPILTPFGEKTMIQWIYPSIPWRRQIAAGPARDQTPRHAMGRVSTRTVVEDKMPESSKTWLWVLQNASWCSVSHSPGTPHWPIHFWNRQGWGVQSTKGVNRHVGILTKERYGENQDQLVRPLGTRLFSGLFHVFFRARTSGFMIIWAVLGMYDIWEYIYIVNKYIHIYIYIYSHVQYIQEHMTASWPKYHCTPWTSDPE